VRYLIIVLALLGLSLLNGVSGDELSVTEHLAPGRDFAVGSSRKVICVIYNKDKAPGVSFIFRRDLIENKNTIAFAKWKDWGITSNVAVNSQVYFFVDSLDLKIPGWDFFRLYDENKNCKQVVGVFESHQHGLTSQWLLPVR
jgi:hypothetical protein